MIHVVIGIEYRTIVIKHVVIILIIRKHAISTEDRVCIIIVVPEDTISIVIIIEDAIIVSIIIKDTIIIKILANIHS